MRGVKLLFSLATACYYEKENFPEMSAADRKYATGALPERWCEKGGSCVNVPMKWMVSFDDERRQKAKEYMGNSYFRQESDETDDSTGQDEQTSSSRPAWLCKNKKKQKKKKAGKNRKH
jgi:hypothetical protein